MLRHLKSPYAFLTLTSLLWAINWVVARAIRDDSGPASMAFGRWFIALVVALPLAWTHLKGDWPAIRANLGVLFLLSLTGAGGHNAVSYAAVAHTTALNAMLLNATVPFFIMGLSWALLRERMGLGQGAGLLLACAGAIWIICAGDPARLASFSFNEGDLLVCAAMITWAIYTIIIKRHPLAIHVTSFVAMLAFIAVLTLLPFAAWEAAARPPRLSLRVLGSVLYMGVGPSVLCYLLWSRGVAALGANRAGLFLYLIPVFGSLVSVLVLGEHPEPYHAVGFGMVLAGLGLANRSAT